MAPRLPKVTAARRERNRWSAAKSRNLGRKRLYDCFFVIAVLCRQIPEFLTLLRNAGCFEDDQIVNVADFILNPSKLMRLTDDTPPIMKSLSTLPIKESFRGNVAFIDPSCDQFQKEMRDAALGCLVPAKKPTKPKPPSTNRSGPTTRSRSKSAVDTESDSEDDDSDSITSFASPGMENPTSAAQVVNFPMTTSFAIQQARTLLHHGKPKQSDDVKPKKAKPNTSDQSGHTEVQLVEFPVGLAKDFSQSPPNED